MSLSCHGGVWERWAGFVTGHPLVALTIALAVLAPLIIPMFSLRLGQEDVGVTPTSTTERQAFDLISAGFGPGYNGPLLVATSLTPAAKPSASYTQAVQRGHQAAEDAAPAAEEARAAGRVAAGAAGGPAAQGARPAGPEERAAARAAAAPGPEERAAGAARRRSRPSRRRSAGRPTALRATGPRRCCAAWPRCGCWDARLVRAIARFRPGRARRACKARLIVGARAGVKRCAPSSCPWQTRRATGGAGTAARRAGPPRLARPSRGGWPRRARAWPLRRRRCRRRATRSTASGRGAAASGH